MMDMTSLLNPANPIGVLNPASPLWIGRDGGGTNTDGSTWFIVLGVVVAICAVTFLMTRWL